MKNYGHMLLLLKHYLLMSVLCSHFLHSHQISRFLNYIKIQKWVSVFVLREDECRKWPYSHPWKAFVCSSVFWYTVPLIGWHTYSCTPPLIPSPVLRLTEQLSPLLTSMSLVYSCWATHQFTLLQGEMGSARMPMAAFAYIPAYDSAAFNLHIYI